MKSSIQTIPVVCSECGSPLSAALRHCPTCQADVGAPNVRACITPENMKALNGKYDASLSRAKSVGCLKEFNDLENLIKTKSGVVVSMPAGVARKLFEDPNFIYENYEKLVGANVRKPAESDNDRHRCAVGGLLFGSYSNRIMYGVLSLNTMGLPTYGDVHCRLRSVTVNKRTSFLIMNSYKFVERSGIVAGDKLPVGCRASWDSRHCLVLDKLSNKISSGQNESEWQALLVRSDGKNRSNDDFIEAHIYDGFDCKAIESMEITKTKLSKEARIDWQIAVSKFNALKAI